MWGGSWFMVEHGSATDGPRHQRFQIFATLQHMRTWSRCMKIIMRLPYKGPCYEMWLSVRLTVLFESVSPEWKLVEIPNLEEIFPRHRACNTDISLFPRFPHVFVSVCASCVQQQDRDSDGLVETRLYLRVATPATFRTYTVVAENAVAVTTKLVQLLHSAYTGPTDRSILAVCLSIAFIRYWWVTSSHRRLVCELNTSVNHVTSSYDISAWQKANECHENGINVAVKR